MRVRVACGARRRRTLRIDAVVKVRRHQHVDDQVAHRLFVRQAALVAQRAVERAQVVALGLRQRPAIRARRKCEQRVELPRLGLEPLALDRRESPR